MGRLKFVVVHRCVLVGLRMDTVCFQNGGLDNRYPDAVAGYRKQALQPVAIGTG